MFLNIRGRQRIIKEVTKILVLKFLNSVDLITISQVKALDIRNAYKKNHDIFLIYAILLDQTAYLYGDPFPFLFIFFFFKTCEFIDNFWKNYLYFNCLYVSFSVAIDFVFLSFHEKMNYYVNVMLKTIKEPKWSWPNA